MIRIFLRSFITRYIRQNNNVRCLNLTGTMIFANQLAGTKDCYVSLVAIDLSQFPSITFGSKLQSDVSSLCSAFVVRGVCRWSLKETVRDITRLVKGRAFSARRKREGCIRMKSSTFTILVYECRPFFREIRQANTDLLLLYNTARALSPLPTLFIRSRIATKELC